MSQVTIDVQARVVQKTLRDAANEARQTFDKAGQEAGKSFSQRLASALDTRGPSQQLSRDMGSAGQNAANLFRTNFNRGMQSAVSEAASNFGVFSRQAEGAMNGILSKGGLAATGVTGIGVAALAAGKQLYDLGVVWDSVTDGIAAKTGKVGTELDAITKSVGDVAKNVALPLDQVGNIAGGVAQALHLTGQPLQTMTEQISELAEVTGQAVDIRELGRAFRVFNVDSQTMPKVLDDIYRASTQSGQSVNELIAIATKGAPALNAFGLSIGQSTGLLSLLETSGVDSGTAVNALTIALKKFADGGLAPQQALRDTITEIKRLNDTGNQIGAIDLAQTTFGRGFAPIFEAIRSGNLDAQALSNTLQSQTSPSIGDMADATRDAVEQFQMLKNKISVDFAPAAKGEFEAINRLLTEMFDTLKAIGDGDWSAVFNGIIDDVTKPFTSKDAPWRKWFDPGTPAITDPNTGLPASQATAPANSRDSGGVPDFSVDPKTGLPRSQSTAPANSRDSGGLPPGMIPPTPGAPGGPPLILPTDPSKGAGAAGTGGPVVPYSGGDPMELIKGLPVTASLYGSAESLLQARYKVEQETAELNVLMKDNTATADQLTKARNEVAGAERDAFKAQLSLDEAEKSANESALKQMNTAATAFGDISAGLDADLGLSNGLPGLADNLVRFVATLGAAPMLAQLDAISKASPIQGGYGLMGQIGAQNIANGRSPILGNPVGGGGVGPASYGQPGAAQPGESARDFAHRVEMPFYQNQGLTVGDHAADKYGEHQNGALDIMVSSLTEGSKVLAQVLSDPNTYGAIFNNQTYGYGHGSTPQDYSGGHTGDPSQDHTNHVHAFFKPGGSNNITPGGVGPTASPTIGAPAAAPTIANPMPSNFPIPLPVIIVGGGMPVGAPPAGPPIGAPPVGPPIGPTALPGTPGVGTGPLPGPPTPWGVPSIPQGTVGGAGEGPIFAPPTGGPGVGAAASQGPVGHAQGAGGWQPQGGGGIGLGGGAMDAAMMAAGGLDLVAPGAGQAAQTAGKLVNRSVQFAGQLAAIGVSGLMETFIPSGGSELGDPSKSWLGRLASGVAGVKPATPTTAGQNQGAQQQGQQQGQQRGGKQGPTVNIESFVQSPDRNGQQTANDLAFKMNAKGGR